MNLFRTGFRYASVILTQINAPGLEWWGIILGNLCFQWRKAQKKRAALGQPSFLFTYQGRFLIVILVFKSFNNVFQSIP